MLYAGRVTLLDAAYSHVPVKVFESCSGVQQSHCLETVWSFWGIVDPEQSSVKGAFHPAEEALPFRGRND